MADALSRDYNRNVEWSLDPDVFVSLCHVFGHPDIDLFASRLNNKLPLYYSWKPDPGASGVNALSISWGNVFGYAFPPFNLINRVLSKLEYESGSVTLICPYWPSQPWFVNLCELLVDVPVLLPPLRSLLRCPVQPSQTHPLLPQMRLIACKLSRMPSLQEEFHQKPSTSLRPAGSHQRRARTHRSSAAGCSFVTSRGLITAVPL